MTFKRDVNLDTSQVEDYRGRRMGGGLVLGGGGVGAVLVATLIYVMLGGSMGDTGSPLNDLLNQEVGQVSIAPDSTALLACKTGADANARDDCRIVGYVDSINKYWKAEFAAQGQKYVLAKTRFFSDSMPSGCGQASRAVGPFYCPTDSFIYIDLGFFEDLQSKFGATGGNLAEAYIIAHEYGHHVQDLLGDLEGRRSEGATGQSVRVELQADCYAGVWVHNAVSTGYLVAVTQDDVAAALNAAQSVGDDRIQKEYQGKVTPETWTHGSSSQRQRWLYTGYQSGDPAKCDTSGDLGA